ncbi:MAG: FAD-dependent oxidoreductase [Bacteroides sp.]|nr:FAD-dependent oxidoreductase [Eubacterium sp.]MCM1419684.1 FAD-dependent oxidoreductase [Roseburia sp.]MCM1463673.1 FAD-dependent oxidoreductase [Bacteroides sp.]
MIRLNEIALPLDYTEEELYRAAAKAAFIKRSDMNEVRLLRRSVDARKKNNVHFSVSVGIECRNEREILKKLPPHKASLYSEEEYTPPIGVPSGKPPVIVGFGPAGMFAALTLAQSGLKPVVLERGQDCAARIASIEAFRASGLLDENSNVQFGEGGAGTFSDGKLTTGIRDPRIRHIFRTLVAFGAPDEILWQAKPHIGTDRLRDVVRNLRNEVIRLGGTILFGAKLIDLGIADGRITSAIYERSGVSEEIETDRLILAIGHSARDTFELLLRRRIEMTQKGFAMGVRIEHLQSEIDRSLYGAFANHPALPAADYKYAIRLPSGRSVYTFCMCPGGSVVGAASEAGGVVTNGMSLFARDGDNANAALLVGTEPSDFKSDDVLAGVALQRRIERAAFHAGGGGYLAPCSLVGDFMNGRRSSGFGAVKPTYLPGVSFASPDEYLPPFICEALREGISLIAKKADFFRAEDAVMTGAETRSSSPVRILRDERLCSVSVRGLYPCGEGAGYAGGIVSAAVDGIKCAEAAAETV